MSGLYDSEPSRASLLSPAAPVMRETVTGGRGGGCSLVASIAEREVSPGLLIVNSLDIIINWLSRSVPLLKFTRPGWLAVIASETCETLDLEEEKKKKN